MVPLECGNSRPKKTWFRKDGGVYYERGMGFYVNSKEFGGLTTLSRSGIIWNQCMTSNFAPRAWGSNNQTYCYQLNNLYEFRVGDLWSCLFGKIGDYDCI